MSVTVEPTHLCERNLHEAANRSTSSEDENPHDLLVFVRSEGSKIRNHHRCQRNRLHLLLHNLSLLWRNKKQKRRERFLGSWWGRGVRKFNHLRCLIRIRSPLYCWKPPWRILARTNLCGQAVERSKKAGEETERCSEVLSLRQEIQTNLATNRNEMNNTRFTWKTLILGKNHGNIIFNYEKRQNTIME